MDFKTGQMIVILTAYDDMEILGNITGNGAGMLTVRVKAAGLLKAGWEVSCLVFDETEIYEFYSRIISAEDNNIALEEPQIDDTNIVEKRRFGRVDCNIGFVARLMFLNDVSVEKLNKSFKGRIKNISAGGMLAETNLCLPKGTIFTFKLKINNFMDCIARVRRISEVPGEKMYEMGCEFLSMKLENIKEVSMFTFKEQLKRKRTELHKSLYR